MFQGPEADSAKPSSRWRSGGGCGGAGVKGERGSAVWRRRALFGALFGARAAAEAWRRGRVPGLRAGRQRERGGRSG